MDPIPPHTMRAAAADVAPDTSGIAVAAPVADIAGAAADISALVDAADTAVVAACEVTCRITRIAEGYETVHLSTGVDQVFLHRGFSFIFPC